MYDYILYCKIFLKCKGLETSASGQDIGTE